LIIAQKGQARPRIKYTKSIPWPAERRLLVFARMASVLWRFIAELNRRPLRRTLSLFDQKDNSRARGRVETERFFQPHFARNCLFQQPL
jgi:hypothetical protein